MLTLPCQGCGFSNEPGERFCGGCGQPLIPAHPDGSPSVSPESYTPKYLAERIIFSKAALEGERKQVTVLFADLKNSLELLSDRDPEEARKLLDPVVERMMAAVHRYEGTVNQVMGDGVMALFGAPLAHEDHAVRACYAALAMQEVIKNYADQVRRKHGVEIQIRVGLNSGEVVVRAIRSDLHMDYSAIGQTTHLAARMEQLAPAGSILLTADTLRLAEGVIQVKPLGRTSVKGLARPLEIFELVGAGQPRARLQVFAARGLTRFVGRQPELELLGRALGLAAGGAGQVVAVIGEPGVGKTRLFSEFLSSPSARGWLLLEGEAVSYGTATPYYPLRDLLRAYFDLEPRSDEAWIREEVTARLRRLDPALESTLPAVLALLDVPVSDRAWLALDPPQRRQRTLDALKRLLLCESQVQPVLLVCENLHWIDTETQAFLDGFVASLRTARILLLVNYRPEYQHQWGGGKPHYTQMRIDPLPPARAEGLLRSLLGDDATLEPLTRALIERTEGNPFFLEESVRTLVESQIVLGEPGAYRLVQALPTLPVPATVQAVLAARMDRLPAEEKTLLQTAAVIGRDVTLVLLQAITELSEGILRGALAHLQTSEFLYEVSLFPEIAYTFKHALTHDVAYGSLLHDRRRVLHARIVETVEQTTPDYLGAQVEQLAYHAIRGEVWEKALQYCHQAGTKAATRSAHRQAVGYFDEALGALEHLPERRDTREQAIDLRFALRAALLPSGNFGRMLACLREAESLASALDDQRRLGQISRLLSLHFWFMGAHDQAIATGHRALALATASGETIQDALANLNLGFAYHAKGNYCQAINCFGRTASSIDWGQRHERFGQVNLPAVTARAWSAWGHAELGTFASGIPLAQEGLQIAEAVAHPSSLMVALWGSGRLSLGQGDVPRALRLLERALAICYEADLPLWFPMVAPALGAAYALHGRTADAVALLTRALEHTTVMETVVFRTICGLSLGEAQMLAGCLEEAQASVGHVLALTSEHGERGNHACALRLVGDIAAHQHPPERERAEAHYREALTQAKELGMRPLEAHCHLSLGQLGSAVGNQAMAAEQLVSAATMYREMDMSFWRERAEAALE